MLERDKMTLDVFRNARNCYYEHTGKEPEMAFMSEENWTELNYLLNVEDYFMKYLFILVVHMRFLLEVMIILGLVEIFFQ